MSSDIVTITNSTRSFLIITVHFLNVADESLNSCCLTAHYMTEGHTGEYIKDCFENITSDFSIDKSKIVNFSTDNGSNMVAAVNLFLGTKKRIPCVAHTINLIIDGVLKNNTNFSNLADQIKRIVTYFKHSVSASDELRSEQLAEGKKEGQILMLIQAVSTRWNSCLDMMERFLKLSSIVAKILASRTKNNVPDMVATSQLTILRDLVTLLGPFKIVTEDLSAEKYVTASLVIPLTNLLKQEIEQTKTSTAIGVSVQNDLLKGIEDRLVPLQENLFLAKATILDPRFKKLHFMSALAAANAISDLSKEIVTEHKIRGNRSPTVGASPRGEKESTSSLWDRHEDLLLKNMSNANEVFGRSFGTMPAELKQYLDQPNISRSSNALKFWIDSRHFTPVLSEIAVKYLISSATSVASERIASTINLLVPNNRSSQTAEHIKQRVFLKTLTEKYWYA
ncbi:hypothetical protein PYW08_011071 [Mythimna loreyi]|nr:hypothetical protein PYW08_011071 [Mythimna loreyi]